MMQQAVFLDRDGTINIEKDYLYKPEDWVWIPNAINAIKNFNLLGLLVIVVTNQSGIARGFYENDDVTSLHCYVDKQLASVGAKIDAYYYCPHHPDFGMIRNCACRKPKPGLLLKAQQDFDIDLKRSFMIGDKYSDVLAGQAVGAASILVATGHGSKEIYSLMDDSLVTAENLYEAYKIVETQWK